MTPTWTPATWRLYRAALSLWFEQAAAPDLARAIRAISTACCRPRTAVPIRRRKTSARKQKHLAPGDMAALYASLAASPSAYAAVTWLLLESGRITGLRPAEWKTAVLDTSEAGYPRLVVANAKSTNGRAHGGHRTLHLVNLPQNDLNTIVQMLRTAHAHTADWDAVYRQCRKVMARHCRRLWPTRDRWPTLYSGRHQFAADAKAAGHTRVEVAAMMGHGTDRTAGAHYGRKRNGFGGGFRARPDQADTERVRMVTEAGTAFAPEADPAAAPGTDNGPSPGMG